MSKRGVIHTGFGRCCLKGFVEFLLFGVDDLFLLNYLIMPAQNPLEESAFDLEVDSTHGFHLIVWNDEVNTFEWVIETLIDICKHEPEQAEQCAWLIHTRGKYAVKNGTYEILKPMCDAITERGIGATIEPSE